MKRRQHYFSLGVAVTLLTGCLLLICYHLFYDISDKCPLVTQELYNVSLGTELFLPMDNVYYAIKKKDMKVILEIDKSDKNTYKKESFDCDEFGFVLMAHIMKLGKKCNYKYRLAFGIMTGFNSETSKRHLMNFFIDDVQEFWCIEPQSDAMTQCNNTGLTILRWVI